MIDIAPVRERVILRLLNETGARLHEIQSPTPRGSRQSPRMLAQIPLTDDEQAAVEDGAAPVDRLLDRLRDTPTPSGPTPRELTALADFIPLTQLTTRLSTAPRC